jgi:hydroxymethylglutaryl-CoA lyase
MLQAPKIKIYEMFMRDGLQSLKKVFNLETKKQFINLLNECNFHCVEFGSSTSPKLLPQMANSFELFSSMNKKKDTHYTMLVPGYSHTEKVIKSGVSSFGLTCSVSETFAQKNLKKTSRETVDNVFNQINLIMENNITNVHIRVYLSCSFGSPWENFDAEYAKKLETYVMEFIQCAKLKKLSESNFDIVISDTVGLSTQKRTREILNILCPGINSTDMNFLAAHIHSKNDNFQELILDCIANNILKFDSSIGAIGGCPFAEDEAFGNISTVGLVEFLNKTVGYCEKYELENIRNVEKEIKKIIYDKN